MVYPFVRESRLGRDFQEAAETPTALSGSRQHEPRLVVPSYDECMYLWPYLILITDRHPVLWQRATVFPQCVRTPVSLTGITEVLWSTFMKKRPGVAIPIRPGTVERDLRG